MRSYLKFIDPANFIHAESFKDDGIRCGSRTFGFKIRTNGKGIHSLRISDPDLWPRDYIVSPPVEPDDAFSNLVGAMSALTVSGIGELRLSDSQGKPLLSSLPGKAFGVCGKAWMFRFRLDKGMQFYGLGEKTAPFERSHRAYRFFNVDTWSDHGTQVVRDEFYDPDYISIPYLIIKQGNTFTGLLVNSAFPAFVSTFPKLNVEGNLKQTDPEPPHFFLGAYDGPPSLFIVQGPSLAELTEKFQLLTGTAPLPPLWALGYHQCRWGYRSYGDLKGLADKFEAHEFPADGLWLDIDYMRGYRVFTFDPKHFSDPATQFERLRRRSYRVVPILDPGVKFEAGEPVYEGGKSRDVFCRNPAGTPYVGIVWPGHTVFPDFSLEEARAWWSEKSEAFARIGPDGAWLDMNEPATGDIDPVDMLFERGNVPHEAYHNQYAMLMAMATRSGFLSARPGIRPFLLSRAGCTGSQKFAAHWTGDNFSTYRHLHLSIGKSLNLALSGMAFNGGDVGGFGGNCTEGLLIDWYKAAFLFPFFRNHCLCHSRNQEPWSYSPKGLRLTRRFVRLRYKLLPYLYNLFVRHEERGEAILRPLFYDFKDTSRLPLGYVNDQFMIGPSIMQAPFTREEEKERTLILPDSLWWSVEKSRWLKGGREITVAKQLQSTPIFLRDGALLPMLPGIRKTNAKDLRRVELLCVVSAGFRGKARTRYVCDDGETFDYREGKRSRYAIEAGRKGSELEIRITTEADGYGEAEFLPVTVEDFQRVVMIRDGRKMELKKRARRENCWGPASVVYDWRP